MKQIILTHGKVALVDDADYERINAYKWYACSEGYARRSIAVATGKRKLISMHREIIPIQFGYQCDHIDGNGLNNQKSNLRQVTKTQNNRNRKAKTGCASRFKGVVRDYEKWRARITVNNNRIHLGSFATESDAARVYNEAAMRFFGEYAKLNVT